MIATILEPGNQVIDWSSRTLDLCSRQGFSFSPAWKTKAPMPCFSSNTCRSLAFLAAWQQEIHATFAFPAAMLQRGEKKAMAQQKCKRTDLLKFSPGKKTKQKKTQHKTKLTRDPRGKMKQVLRFDVTKHNSSEEWTGRRVDVVRAVRWCCMDALVCVNLGPVKGAFTRALSHLPTPSNPRMAAHPRRGDVTSIPSLSWFQPESLSAALFFFFSFPPHRSKSQLKAGALTNLLWSLILTLPDARPLTPSSSSAQRGANDIMYKNQDPKSPAIKSTGSSLSVRRANADSIYYLAVAEEEAAASCVRYSRSSLDAWKRP